MNTLPIPISKPVVWTKPTKFSDLEIYLQWKHEIQQPVINVLTLKKKRGAK